MVIFRRYRLLLIVIALVAISLHDELTSKKSEPAAKAPAAPGAPASNFGYGSRRANDDDEQLKDVLTELYPDSTDTLLNQGAEAMIRDDDDKARASFQRAIDSGVKSNEDLLYLYAMFLIRENASKAEIDAAVERWHYNFPFSRLPDPRKPRARTLRASHRL
ncbi:MAG: hypothetical protein AB7O26_14840 [Planctomycetaceae bacterium]